MKQIEMCESCYARMIEVYPKESCDIPTMVIAVAIGTAFLCSLMLFFDYNQKKE